MSALNLENINHVSTRCSEQIVRTAEINRIRIGRITIIVFTQAQGRNGYLLLLLFVCVFMDVRAVHTLEKCNVRVYAPQEAYKDEAYFPR